jgi:ssDNA-binding Zn-finger/Zn-ribbon topoisomerase 1
MVRWNRGCAALSTGTISLKEGLLLAEVRRVTTEQFGQILQGKAVTIILIAGGAGLLALIGKILLEKAIFAIVRFIKYGPKKAVPVLSEAEQNAVLDASPACPKCGGAMANRTAKQGANAGSTVWGCRTFPECRGTRSM